MDNATETSPPPQQPPAGNGVTLQRPFIVALLYLLNIFLGFSVIVGVILAYIWRGEDKTEAWEQTHYTYLIRTFWIGIGVVIAMFVLFILLAIATSGGYGPGVGVIMVMFLAMGLFLLSAAWFCVRSILSMVKAGNREPMPNPESWLF